MSWIGIINTIIAAFFGTVGLVEAIRYQALIDLGRYGDRKLRREFARAVGNDFDEKKTGFANPDVGRGVGVVMAAACLLAFLLSLPHTAHPIAYALIFAAVGFVVAMVTFKKQGLGRLLKQVSDSRK